jgi:hypothetical protein
VLVDKTIKLRSACKVLKAVKAANDAQNGVCLSSASGHHDIIVSLDLD